MLNILLARWHQGRRTIAYPQGGPGSLPPLPDRFRGKPVTSKEPCPAACKSCIESCPTTAVQLDPARKIQIDLGRCLFCGDCEQACPKGMIHFTGDHALTTRTREDLVVSGDAIKLAKALDQKTQRIFGRSLKLRQVSAGGCNACEADVNVLSTVVFDLGRFGIQFVASPRHADGVLITGPITRNMRLALEKTYAAVPAPRFVIAVGACAISGGPFAGHPEVHNGAESTLPVDLFIPGCPPHPLTILDGLLRLLDRHD